MPAQRQARPRKPAPPEPTTIDLRHRGNEASDLLPVASDGLLAAHNWDQGFWTIMDEGPVDENIAVIGHAAGAEDDDGWVIHRLEADAGKESGKTDDPEALARKDGWVYVLGSHYGKKAGPLRGNRQWVARFRESDLERHLEDEEVQLHVVRDRFRLHRIVNDALLVVPVEVIRPGDTVRTQILAQTIEKGDKDGKSWAGRVGDPDVPMNIEGAAFRPNGNLLLALRYPCTVKGEPILVELEGVEGMFDDPQTWPRVRRVWSVTGVTPRGALVGWRALTPSETDPDTFDGVVGSLDALDKGSALLEDHPEGGDVHCRHVRVSLGDAGDLGGPVRGQVVQDFKDLKNVEGISVVGGQTFYVTDEAERVQLRFAETLA